MAAEGGGPDACFKAVVGGNPHQGPSPTTREREGFFALYRFAGERERPEKREGEGISCLEPSAGSASGSPSDDQSRIETAWRRSRVQRWRDLVLGRFTADHAQSVLHQLVLGAGTMITLDRSAAQQPSEGDMRGSDCRLLRLLRSKCCRRCAKQPLLGIVGAGARESRARGGPGARLGIGGSCRSACPKPSGLTTTAPRPGRAPAASAPPRQSRVQQR